MCHLDFFPCHTSLTSNTQDAIGAPEAGVPLIRQTTSSPKGDDASR
jgi:hypothetical protein